MRSNSCRCEFCLHWSRRGRDCDDWRGRRAVLSNHTQRKRAQAENSCEKQHYSTKDRDESKQPEDCQAFDEAPGQVLRMLVK